ncbi:MAG: SLBB domain-containing protein, partial [Muribaculaceae bacterium]|nr:SLBB domain-containing protein [Muribaculaceae bacterium]
DGQVLFPGDYVLQSRNERLSELIKRSGGLLESAYVQGAYLKRQLTPEERARREETIRLAKANSEEGTDSISLDKLNLDDVQSVGINLQKALENPGSSYDVVLQAGDRLYIPELQSTVKISGDVLFPNTVVYVPGKKLNYYIDQAGGYSETARKNKAYVVYMNGSASKAKGSTVIEPGSQIIVPSKPKDSGFDWTKVLSIATTLGSLASMTAAVVAIFKK